MKNKLSHPMILCGVAAGLLFASAKVYAQNPTVFADFEGGSWGAWTVEGTAFGEAPVIVADDPRTKIEDPTRQLTNASGKAIASSWRDGSSDAAKGKITSPEFTITKPVISFLIGGGRDEKLLCINLLIDGKIVRSSTGSDTDNMADASWNVADLKGKKAKIEVVDDKEGPWAHIEVDQIEFRDK